jgi:hypothetical protein
MSASITCYPQPGKEKALRVCEAFAAGARAAGVEAYVCASIPPKLQDGDCFFYGVRPAFAHLWTQCKSEGRAWFYGDNSYTDAHRETYFRVTKNALQADGLNASWSGDGVARFKALGLTVQPWRNDGAHIVICPQTEEFMRGAGGFEGDWLAETTAKLRSFTDRELRIRRKCDKRPLSEDLRGAWALVTHMSCAAVEAVLAGVPVFCTGRCAARWMGTSDLSLIETPVYPERREEWAAVLAANQWSEAELRDGTAWAALNG